MDNHSTNLSQQTVLDSDLNKFETQRLNSMWPYPVPVERFPQFRNVFHETSQANELVSSSSSSSIVNSPVQLQHANIVSNNNGATAVAAPQPTPIMGQLQTVLTSGQLNTAAVSLNNGINMVASPSAMSTPGGMVNTAGLMTTTAINNSIATMNPTTTMNSGIINTMVGMNRAGTSPPPMVATSTTSHVNTMGMNAAAAAMSAAAAAAAASSTLNSATSTTPTNNMVNTNGIGVGVGVNTLPMPPLTSSAGVNTPPFNTTVANAGVNTPIISTAIAVITSRSHTSVSAGVNTTSTMSTNSNMTMMTSAGVNTNNSNMNNNFNSITSHVATASASSASTATPTITAASNNNTSTSAQTSSSTSTSTSVSTQEQPPPNQILTRMRLQDLVREVDPNEQLDEDVEDVLLHMADDFVESAISAACLLAKHRKSNTVEVKDLQLHLERNWNMWIPGFGTDELRPYKRSTVTEAHKQRMTLIRKTLKKY